jgi:hypothetical protein
MNSRGGPKLVGSGSTTRPRLVLWCRSFEWRTSFFAAQELGPEEHLGRSESLGANLFSGSIQDVFLAVSQAKLLMKWERTTPHSQTTNPRTTAAHALSL